MRFDDAELDAIADRLADRLLARIGERLTPPIDDHRLKTWWTEKEAADAIGVAWITLRNWRRAGCISAATAKRPIIYRREHLDAAAKFMEGRGAA